MSRKDIIIMSVLVNAGLIVILLVSSLTTKQSYFAASSAKVAGSILDTNENGMLPTAKSEEKIEIVPTNIPTPISTIVSTEEKGSEEPIVKPEGCEEIIHKLPLVASSESSELKAEISENEKPQENKFMEVVVKKGDTLEKIAKANNISVSDILKINELQNSFLKIGQTILVPKMEFMAKDESRKAALVNKLSDKADYYTVKVGDNPWTIAIKHHMKVEELLKLNKLNSLTAKKLRPGDKLRIK